MTSALNSLSSVKVFITFSTLPITLSESPGRFIATLWPQTVNHWLWFHLLTTLTKAILLAVSISVHSKTPFPKHVHLRCRPLNPSNPHKRSLSLPFLHIHPIPYPHKTQFLHLLILLQTWHCMGQLPSFRRHHRFESS